MSEAAPRPGGWIHGLGLALAACVVLLAFCAMAHAGAAAPQAANPASPAAPAGAAPTAVPAWDVSTVKPSSPDARVSMFNATPDGIKITNVPLVEMVRRAFGLEPDRVIAGTGMAKINGNFDIEAKVAPEDAPKLKTLTMEQRRQMMVALLEERCGLKYHHETRALPFYELVVAKGGIKMQASKPDADGPNPGPLTAQRPGKHTAMMRRGHIESTGTGMSGLVRMLSGQLGRTVVDKTGLTGDFDYKLDWTPDDTASAMTKSSNPGPGDNTTSQDAAGPSLFTALEEQLGLKLESTKGPVDVIVIDQLEQPTAN
jgi:uncharacterized protein (TIGR03435 family)